MDKLNESEVAQEHRLSPKGELGYLKEADYYEKEE